jgi:hypothetical protein
VPSENIAMLRRGYEAISRGDFDSVMEMLDPEIVMHDRPESPDAGTYHGHAGALEALRQTDDFFDDVEMAPEEMHESGDQIVVVLTLRGRGRESGVPVEERIAHLWTVREGRALALRAFTDPGDALRAAGIPPG